MRTGKDGRELTMKCEDKERTIKNKKGQLSSDGKMRRLERTHGNRKGQGRSDDKMRGRARTIEIRKGQTRTRTD